MEDVGLWNNSMDVASALQRKGLIGDDLYSEISDVRYTYPDLEDFIDSPENREFLDEIRSVLKSSGYDGVKYKNLVESEYGDAGTKILDSSKKDLDAAREALRRYEDKILERRPPLPDDPTDKTAMRRFLDSSGNALDYATPDEAAQIQAMDAAISKIQDNPANYADPYSYIIFDPSNIRSRFAAFDPSKADSADLLAANPAMAGILGMYMQQGEQ